MLVKSGSANDLGKIRIELCKMNCRVHMKLPEILRVGDSLQFHTCCDDFKSRVQVRFEELLVSQPTKQPGGNKH